MINAPDVDAVLIASETSTHAELAIAAIRAGKHVLLEKPISVDVELSRPVVEAAAMNPAVKVMVGFSRRFDDSFVEAKAMVDAGALGETYLLKSSTNDQYDESGFFVAYSKASGGIFIDCGIHDIDLARWLLRTASIKNPRKEVTRVFGSGMNVRHPELEKTGDCDNALGIIEFENGTRAMIHLSRTAIHGHDTVSEVFGTEGKVVVNGIRVSIGLRFATLTAYARSLIRPIMSGSARLSSMNSMRSQALCWTTMKCLPRLRTR